MYYYCFYMFVWFSTNTYVGETRSVETMHHTVERCALSMVKGKTLNFYYSTTRNTEYILQRDKKFKTQDKMTTNNLHLRHSDTT
jgi:hypothetical protein